MYYNLDIVLKFYNFPKLLKYHLALYSYPKVFTHHHYRVLSLQFLFINSSLRCSIGRLVCYVRNSISIWIIVVVLGFS